MRPLFAVAPSALTSVLTPAAAPSKLDGRMYACPPGRRLPATWSAGGVSYVRSIWCGSAALPRMTSSDTFEPAAPWSNRVPGHGRHVARGRVVDHADEIARLEFGAGRRRAVAHADDAHIELVRDDEADVCRTERRPGVEGFDLVGHQIGARGIEVVHQPAHGAIEHLVGVHVVHVVVDDERDRVRKGRQRLERLLRHTPRRAEQAADDDERHERRRNEENDQPGAPRHATHYLIGDSAWGVRVSLLRYGRADAGD